MFSDQEISQLTAEIDTQLLELRSLSGDVSLRSGDKEAQLVKQNQAIERATGEPADTFLKKFWRASKRDLCEEGGLLNSQWKKWGDLDNKDLLTVVGSVFKFFGLEASVAVAVALPVAVIILHLGARTFCEEYGENS